MPKPLYQSLKSIGRSTALALAVFEMASSNTAYGQNLIGATSGDDVFTFSSIINPALAVTLSQGNDTLNIGAGDTLTSFNNTGTVISSGSGLTVNNDGTILAGSSSNTDGIVAVNANGPVVINNTGLIQTNATGASVAAGIQVANTNGTLIPSLTVDNAGTITSVRQGIFLGVLSNPPGLTSATITNRAGGLIQSTSGVATGGARNQALSLGNLADTVVNEAGATIDGQILLFGGDDVLTNSGALIDTAFLNLGAGNDILTNEAGGTIAGNVFGEAGNDMITNSGTITGNVGSGSGNDTIVNNSGATITGVVDLGTGDDAIVNGGTISGIPFSTSSVDAVIDFGAGFDNLTNNAGGIIEATGSDRAAIRVEVPTNSITNAGTIRATAEVIFINGLNADLTGGIINLATGQIIGDTDNSGLGLNGSSAIRLLGGDLSGGINNAGLIEHNTVTAIAIEPFGGLVTGLIANSGTIRGGSVGIVIAFADLTSGVENSGLIIGTANTGITVTSSGSDISGGVTNLAGGVIAGGGAGVVVQGDSNDLSGGITNSGTISGTSVAGRGIAVIGSSGNDLSGGITNLAGGVITGVQAGVFVDSFQSLSGGIVNAADGVISGGTGVLVNNSASISGGIVNSGTIEGDGGTAIAFAGANGATFITLAGGRIVGDVIDSNAAAGGSPVTVTAAGFQTEGDFLVSDLVVNAGQDFTISAGDSVTLATQSQSAGTLRFEFGPTSVGTLNVSGPGNGINLAGATVEAVVDPTRPLADGDEILIGTGDGPVVGLSGTTGQVLTQVVDNSVLFDFAVADGGQADILSDTDNTNLFFQIAQVATAADSAITPNAQRVGATIDNLPATSSPELNAVLTEVGLAVDSESLDQVLQGVLPQIDRSAFLVSEQLGRHSVRLVSDRLTVIRTHQAGTSNVEPAFEPLASYLDQGLDESDVFDPSAGVQLWGQFFVQDLNQDSGDTVQGFDATARGFTIGVDSGDATDTAVVGAAFSYADANVRSDSVNGTRADIDSFDLTVYGDYDLNDTDYLVGEIGFTYGVHDATRFNLGGVAGLDADSDYDSFQIHARLIAARDYFLGEGLVLTPKIQARYVHHDTESFSETGAGGAGLNIDNDAVDLLEFGVGVDLRKDFEQDNGAVVSTELSVGYRYDVIGERVQTTSSFIGGGDAFFSEGADPDQGTLNLGAAVGYTAANHTEWTLSYDYEVRGDLDAQSVQLRLAIPF